MGLVFEQPAKAFALLVKLALLRNRVLGKYVSPEHPLNIESAVLSAAHCESSPDGMYVSAEHPLNIEEAF